MKVYTKNDRLPPKRIHIHERPVPDLNLPQFTALYNILWDSYKNNDSMCSRHVGVSRATWIRWRKFPPTQWYWTLVLREVIRLSIPAIIANRGISKLHQDRIINALSDLPKDNKKLERYIQEEVIRIRGSVYHLRELLEQYPGGLSPKKLLLPAYSGGYTFRTLQAASIILGVIKRQEGYGANKKTRWFLPIEDEEDNVQYADGD